jgi:hypothetical protein
MVGKTCPGTLFDPFDWGSLLILVGIVALPLLVKQILFPGVRENVSGFVIIGMLFAYTVYRLITFLDR